MATDTATEDLRRWYRDRRDDYAAVRRRLRACRNVVLNGPESAAARLLRMSTVNAVLSIQTARERHERAFTAYYAGDRSLETAAGMTVYGNQKADWLHASRAVDYGAAVRALRDDGPRAAHRYMVEHVKGLSWTKAGFTLAMSGVWELACPDSRTRQVLGREGRIRNEADYLDAVRAVDDRLQIDEPPFLKQWVMYDYFAGEHATHAPFFTEFFGRLPR